jgi:hypothetical protein
VCNETGLWTHYEAELELSCSLYTSNIKAHSMVFKNVFCLLCNGFEVKLPTKICGDKTPGFGSSFSFTGLIKRVSQTGQSKEGHVTSTCKESSILDTTTVSWYIISYTCLQRLKYNDKEI